MEIRSAFYGYFSNVNQHANINQQPKFKYLNQHDTVSFSRKTVVPIKNKIMALKEEDFPSEGLRLYIIGNINNPQNAKSVVELHKEYYAELLACETLEEAKEIYPEFADVKSAADSDILNDKVAMNTILRGQKRGLTTKNASLELLKQYYAKLTPLREESAYFDIPRHSTAKLLDKLNIKMSEPYYKVISSQQAIDRNKANWQNSAYRDNASKKAANNWQREEYVNNQRQGREDTNVKKQISALAKKEANRRHPEYTEVRRDVAKGFPGLGYILTKKLHGEPLTEKEQAALIGYYKACSMACPDMNKVIGQTQKEVLHEWDYYGKDLVDCHELYKKLTVDNTKYC